MAFYVGPDQAVPVASAIATVGGLVLLFGHKVRRLLAAMGNLLRRGCPSADSSPPKPQAAPPDAPARQ